MINTSETQINQIHDLLGYQLQTESEITSNPYSNLDVNQFEKLINEYLRKEAWKESEIQIFIEEFKNTITHRLVFITETQDKKVGFVIRSLQEFFAANYYMNVNENEIRSRILKIATSAYWRNTLIFSIGNLRINKEYLVDDVFTICEELNGLGNSSKDISVASSIKSGSWLALDILTEGIISDAKKFLNKFITLLDPLIDTPLITDHRKFSKLNDTLKSDWIIDEFLIKRLYDNNIKSPFTFYEISCIMIKTSNIGNTVKLKTKLYETVSNKNRIIFFNALYMIREIDELFINLFLDILLNYPPLTLEYIFRSELESNSFIDSTIDKAIMNKNADQIKRFLEEIILIALKLNSSTNNSIKRIISFLEKIVQKKLANINFTPPNYSFIHDTYKINYYVLYGCLNVEIISVYDKNLTNINIFKNICEVYNLKYLFLYFTYLTFPTLENLMNFLTELDTQNSNVKNRFISTTNDWLLNFILKSCDNRLTKISITNILAALNILNQDDISIKEAEITNSNREDIKLKFATSTSYNVSESVAGIKKLISIIKSNEKNYIDADVINSLVTLFNISNTFKNSRSKPSEVDFIIECISTMQVDYSFIKQTDLISLWFFIISEGNKQKIYKLLVNSKFFDKLDFDKFSYFYHITLLSEIVESFYKQAVDLLNVFINLENDNEFIVFLTYVTMNSEVAEFEAPKIYLSKLNFNSLINNKYTSSIDKISQFILSLFSNTNPWPNNQFVIDIYINLRNENPKLFSYLIRVVNNYVLDKLWITTLVLSITNLNSFNSENDNNAKSDYLSYLKNVSESRKSDI